MIEGNRAYGSGFERFDEPRMATAGEAIQTDEFSGQVKVRDALLAVGLRDALLEAAAAYREEVRERRRGVEKRFTALERRASPDDGVEVVKIVKPQRQRKTQRVQPACLTMGMHRRGRNGGVVDHSVFS